MTWRFPWRMRGTTRAEHPAEIHERLTKLETWQMFTEPRLKRHENILTEIQGEQRRAARLADERHESINAKLDLLLKYFKDSQPKVEL